jgi:DNA mismatch repair protein MutS2
MNITEKTLSTLEFDKIRQMLADSCHTAGAAQMALMLTPTDRLDVAKQRQMRTTDAKRLADAKGMPSFGSVSDVSDLCERALKGAILTPRELLDAAALMRTSRQLLEYIRTNKLFTITEDYIRQHLPSRLLAS